VKLELELTQSEYDDLTLVAEQRPEEPEKTGHDLLVAAVDDELNKTGARPTVSQRWGLRADRSLNGRVFADVTGRKIG